jgi:hypothetical protein
MISAIRPSGSRVFASVVPMRRLSSTVRLNPDSSRMRSSPTRRGSPSADCVTRLSRRCKASTGIHWVRLRNAVAATPPPNRPPVCGALAEAGASVVDAVVSPVLTSAPPENERWSST